MERKMKNKIWKCLIVLVLLELLGGNDNNNGVVVVEGFVGINWGRFATHQLLPSMVVDLLLQNGLSNVQMFSPRPSALVAFENSSIGVTVTLPRNFIMNYKYSNLKNISDWIDNLFVPPIRRGVNITTLVVIHEPLLIPSNKLIKIVWDLNPIFNQTRTLLDNHNLTYVKTTTSHFMDVINIVKKPSQADFRPDIKDVMLQHLAEINRTNSFFTYNIFPITAVELNKWPVEFGFMDNKSNFTVVDGEYEYRNAFEFMYDALVVALEKAGFPDMEIVIGEIGWPTDGQEDANPKNAERFYRGFLPHIAKKKGTPRRPNRAMDVYLYTLSDENLMLYPTYGPYIRHWGIYEYDGTPKFPIDLTGEGRRVLPATAKGTVKMPSRWCVFNGNMSNATNVDLQMQTACSMSDCTSLQPGGSCSKLNYTSRVSYAFNAAYQTYNQGSMNCWFGRLGKVTTVNPSVGDCQFPVEILTAETVDGGKQIITYINYEDNIGQVSAQHRGFNLSLSLSIALPIFVIFFAFKFQ